MAFRPFRSACAATIIPLFLLTIIAFYSVSTLTDSACAAQLTVAWDPETDPAITGYKVYWGTLSKNYSWSGDAGAQTTYTVPSLNQGATYYFAATAYDATRTESGFSNEVTYTVPSACTYATTPAGQSFGAGGGTGTVAVAAGPACNWTTTNGSSWVSIASGTSGTGSGTVSYSVAANTGTASRTAGLTIAGTIFTIDQAGAQTYTLTIVKNGSGSGTVISSPTGTTFNPGTSVTLTATPGSNSSFAGWSGSCSGTSTTCTVIMNSSLSVNASFTLKSYTITASAETGGSISPSGSLQVNGGSNLTFRMTPAAGYKIANVIADGTSIGTANSYTFRNVTSNHTIRASFTAAAKTHRFTTTKAGSVQEE